MPPNAYVTSLLRDDHRLTPIAATPAATGPAARWRRRRGAGCARRAARSGTCTTVVIERGVWQRIEHDHYAGSAQVNRRNPLTWSVHVHRIDLTHRVHRTETGAVMPKRARRVLFACSILLLATA